MGHDLDVPKKTKKSTRASVDKGLVVGVDGLPCCSTDPVKQLDDVQRMASVIEHEIEDAAKEATGEEHKAEENFEGEKQPIEEKEVQVVDVENVEAVVSET